MCAAWALGLPDDAAISHSTAAALYGAPIEGSAEPHVVLTPRRVLPRWDGSVVHGRRMLPDDLADLERLRVTSGARTVLDLAALLPAPELVAVGDSLVRSGHLTASDRRA